LFEVCGDSMIPFTFNVPTKIVFEPGSIGGLGERLSSIGVNSALVVTDKGVMGAGCLEGIFSSLDSSGIVHETYDGVEQNPTENNVREALRILKDCNHDSIVAVGGGSSIDTAKGMVASLKEGRDISELYQGVMRGTAPLPLVAIPTTAGTGSEVTWSAVITDKGQKVKETARGEYMYPRMAIVDPEITVSLPPTITASTGMDALTHSLEAFITRGAHAMSDAMAMESTMLIFRHLREAVHQGKNMTARGAMSVASTLGGMAFSISGLGMVHGMAEPLGGRFNIPHGIANSILLPHCLEFNCDAVEDKLSLLARLLGINGDRSAHETSHSLVREVNRLSDDVGIPRKLDITIGREEFDSLVDDALGNSCLPANPKKVKRGDIEGIYSRIIDVE
jgi:alcohol dehydrogenase class IV